MFSIAVVTIKGFYRDRVFYAILSMAFFFVAIPAVSSLSMRQVTSLALTLSLSLVSFILLLLAVFLGGTTLWRDVERRYCHSVLGLPVDRKRYVLGRFAGVALFILLVTGVLAVFAAVAIAVVSSQYPPAVPLLWWNICVVFIFEALKYILLVACAFLFASVSTSFFLPIFGSITIFVVGSAMQQVYDYVNSPAAGDMSGILRSCVSALYYVVPNFSAFDLKVQAVYSLSIDLYSIGVTLLYFVVYLSVVLCLAVIMYSRRELL